MTLASAISGGNLTKIRANAYHAQQFVVTVPDVVVVQFQPGIAPSDNVYAEIDVGSVASGSMSDVKTLQCVIYSLTSDYGATETYRNYVRKVSGTDTLYVGQTGQSLTESMYVTVLNTYEPIEKPRTVRGGTEYADWDIAFRRLLPVETALPTAVVLTGGETAYSPTAVPAAIDNDASSSFTHAWESSNSNDSLDSGGTTDNPSFTLEAAAHRWIRYTATDSNGNPITRVISVWTVPKNLSGVINEGFTEESGDIANISYSQEDGWACSLAAYKDIAALRPGTMVCVFSIESYNGTIAPIESNIDFVGYLGNEVTETRGDETYSVISETRFECNGIGSMMNLVPISTLSMTASSNPTAWGQIEKPTPVRAIVYLLTEHTTFLNLCAFSFPADHTDFIAPGKIFDSQYDITMEAVRYEADAMDGILQFAHDGRIDMTRNLVQSDDTARDAAPVVATWTLDDVESFVIEWQPVQTIRMMQLHAGVFNTTTNKYTSYQSQVPPLPDIHGTTIETRSNVILTTDSSLTDAKVEFAGRAANLYAALNPAFLVRVTFKDELRFLQPDVGAWHKFTVSVNDTVRGIAFGSSSRWQLIDIGYRTNNLNGTHGGIPATFRLETKNTGANVTVAQIRYPTTVAAQEFVFLPGVTVPGTQATLEFTDNGEWYDSESAGAPDDPIPPADSTCENFSLLAQYGATGVETVQSALNGEQITVAVRGWGAINGTGDPAIFVYSDDLESGGESGFTYENDAGNALDGENRGSITAGVGEGGGFGIEGAYQDSPFNNGLDRAGVYIDFGEEFPVSAASMRYRAGGDAVDNTLLIRFYDASKTEIASVLEEGTPASADWRTYSDATLRAGVQYILFAMNVNNADSTGKAYIDNISVTYGDGTAASPSYGDAYYFASDESFSDVQPYPPGGGFLIEGVEPATRPPYNAEHAYETIETVTSGTVDFSFLSQFGNENAENWQFNGTACFNGVP